MNVRKIYGAEAEEEILVLLTEFYGSISIQMQITLNRLKASLASRNSFLLISESGKGNVFVWCGFQIDEEMRVVNIPIFFVRQDISQFLKAKAVMAMLPVFKVTLSKYDSYAVFLMAVNAVAKLVLRRLSPPFEYVGELKGYFEYPRYCESAKIFWKRPSNVINE